LKKSISLGYINPVGSESQGLLEGLQSILNNLKINYEIKSRRAGDIVQEYANYYFVKNELVWLVTNYFIVNSIQTAWRFQQQLDNLTE